MNFKILINDAFASVAPETQLNPIARKHVVSIANGFEDGEWRYDNFQNFIWDNVTKTALSYKEREALIDNQHSSLIAAAKNLRLTDANKKDISKGSEIAEIVLYGIMEHYYSALPVVPKIFYKQNAQDNAKGADSVHLVIEGDDDFSLWFGEAKFYNSIEDARLPSIVQSVYNSLDTAKLKKENSIITNVEDIGSLINNEVLLDKIRNALSNRASIDILKPKIHVPILLLHECQITKGMNSADQSQHDCIKKYHVERAEAYFKSQINKLSSIHMYDEITFHLVIFPIPYKEKIVNKFIENATFYKAQ